MKETFKQIIYAWLTKLLALILSFFFTGTAQGFQAANDTPPSPLQTVTVVDGDTYDRGEFDAADPLWISLD